MLTDMDYHEGVEETVSGGCMHTFLGAGGCSGRKMTRVVLYRSGVLGWPFVTVHGARSLYSNYCTAQRRTYSGHSPKARIYRTVLPHLD